MVDARANSLLRLALGGSAEALGELMEEFRTQLLYQAKLHLDASLRRKVSAADVVQDTFLKVHESFPGFRGQSIPEFWKWLRFILNSHVVSLSRRYGTGKRSVNQEVSLDELGGDSEAPHELIDGDPTPTTRAMHNEQEQRLAQAMASLPEVTQQIIRLRNEQFLSFEAIAQKLGRTEAGVRKLWSRGIDHLREWMNREKPKD